MTGFFTAAWNGIQGVWDAATGFFENIWNTIEGIFSVVESVLSGDFEGAWNAIQNVFDGWEDFFSGLWEDLTGIFSDAWDVFSGIGSDIVNGIKNGISSAWEGLKSWFNGLWNGLFGNRKASVTVEKRAVDAATSRSASLASASRMIADAPRLATGSVIPPKREFLAVLGDNKQETEVVSPLSTIEQALENVMSQMGSASPQQINLVVDGKVLAKVIVPKINDMTRQAGRSVLLI